jgi:GH15 family glucan-1,4-alpha-glucosidase
MWGEKEIEHQDRVKMELLKQSEQDQAIEEQRRQQEEWEEKYEGYTYREAANWHGLERVGSEAWRESVADTGHQYKRLGRHDIFWIS